MAGAGCHRGSRGYGLARSGAAGRIVVHVVQAHGVGQVLDLLEKALVVGEGRIPSSW